LDLTGPTEVFDRLMLPLLVSAGAAHRWVPGPVPEIKEVKLTLRTTADDSSCDTDLRSLVVGQVCRQREHRFDRHVAVEASAPGIEAEGLDGPPLIGTAGLEHVGHGGGLSSLGGICVECASRLRIGL